MSKTVKFPDTQYYARCIEILNDDTALFLDWIRNDNTSDFGACIGFKGLDGSSDSNVHKRRKRHRAHSIIVRASAFITGIS
eukprot:scaffold2770_cov104-Cylindrotheca_fusiformis.AAC.4